MCVFVFFFYPWQPKRPGAASPQPGTALCMCTAPLLLPLGSFPFNPIRSAGTGSHRTINIARQGWAIWFEKQNKINTAGSNLRCVARNNPKSLLWIRISQRDLLTEGLQRRWLLVLGPWMANKPCGCWPGLRARGWCRCWVTIIQAPANKTSHLLLPGMSPIHGTGPQVAMVLERAASGWAGTARL